MNACKILLYVLVLSLAGCGPTTRMEKTWKDPAFTPDAAKSYKKLLVIAPIKDESTRRIVEDKVVKSFKKVTAVPSYSYLQPTDTIQGVVDDRLKKDGFDGEVIMRLGDVDKSVSYVPGTTYWGWYGYGHGSPGYYQEDRTYYVETNFYSLESGKLLWSGTTSSVNPNKLDRTLDDIIATLKSELQKQKLISK
jgi:hypothetical protein